MCILCQCTCTYASLALVFLAMISGAICRRCIAVQACATDTHVNLDITLLFDTNILHSDCEIVQNDVTIIHIIENLNTCQMLRRSDINSAVIIAIRCPICNSSINIIHKIGDDMMGNATSCPLAMGENNSCNKNHT